MLKTKPKKEKPYGALIKVADVRGVLIRKSRSKFNGQKKIKEET